LVNTYEAKVEAALVIPGLYTFFDEDACWACLSRASVLVSYHAMGDHVLWSSRTCVWRLLPPIVRVVNWFTTPCRIAFGTTQPVGLPRNGHWLRRAYHHHSIPSGLWTPLYLLSCVLRPLNKNSNLLHHSDQEREWHFRLPPQLRQVNVVGQRFHHPTRRSCEKPMQWIDAPRLHSSTF
jgi:hypothetical protein